MDEVEQERYFKEITKACLGCDENARSKALKSLSEDPRVALMLNRFSIFILDEVKTSKLVRNLAYLIYLMRMVQALVNNRHIRIICSKNLKELLSSLAYCIILEPLCKHPFDNHWALRDFASRIISQFVKKCSHAKVLIVRVFGGVLTHTAKLPLESLYGVLKGVSVLGAEAIRSMIIPRIKLIGRRIEIHLKQIGASNVHKIASERIKSLLVNELAPIIKTSRNPPDSLDEYTVDYGYLGPVLHSAVLNARQQSPSSSSSPPNCPVLIKRRRMS